MARFDVAHRHERRGWMYVGGGDTLLAARVVAKDVLKKRKDLASVSILEEVPNAPRKVVECVTRKRPKWWPF